MRNLFVRLVGLVAVCLYCSQFVYGQAATATPVRVKDNRNQQIKRVKLYYKRTGDRDYIPAKDDLLISENSIMLKIAIDFQSISPSQAKIRIKAELRRVCKTPMGPGLNSRVTEYFTSTEPIEGEDRVLDRDHIDIEIPLENCATGCIPNSASSLVCRHGDPDHLGEGPYQAVITTGPERSSLQDDQTSRLVYNYDFATVSDRDLQIPGRSNRLKDRYLRRSN